MAFNITDFTSRLQFGGARPSLFQVIVTNPADNRGAANFPFMVHAASLPASTLGQIPMSYFGRPVKYPGNRQYDNWQVEVINDESFDVRASLEAWSARINTYIGNIRGFGSSAPAEYLSRGQILQYGQAGDVVRVYNFEGLWPVHVGAIQTSWDQANAIEVFPVEFSVNYWTIAGEDASN